MPTLATPARIRARAALARDARARLRRAGPGPSGSPDDDGVPLVNWLVATLGGSFLAAAAGWIVVTGLCVLGWLTGSLGPVSAAVGLGTQLWLLANGAGATIGSTHWSLIPLGVTVVFACMLANLAGFAARQAAATRLAQADADELDRPAQAQIVRRVVWLMSVVYVAVVTVVALALGAPGQALRGFLLSAVLAALSTWWGAARGLGFSPTERWPSWLRAVPRAVGASLGVLALGGCAALISALVLHHQQVTAITAGLGVDVLGGVVLAILQLAFWPNAVIWSASWTLGAGFTLGDGSLVAPSDTNLGLLPSVPLFGALPAEGPGSWAVLSWLAVGVVAGAVGASIIVRARPAARFDETCLVGGLSGVLSGLVTVGVAAASRGDLGTGRLVGLGPRLLELGVMACTLMGLAGMLAGLAWGLLRRPGHAEGVVDDEPTTVLDVEEGDLDPDEADLPTTRLRIRPHEDGGDEGGGDEDGGDEGGGDEDDGDEGGGDEDDGEDGDGEDDDGEDGDAPTRILGRDES